MATVTISQKEYKRLAEAKLRYEYLRAALEDDLFSPPSQSKEKILAELRATGNYNKRFLESVRRGLARSSFFK